MSLTSVRPAVVLAAVAAAVGGALLVAPAASALDVVPAEPAVGGTLYLANADDGTDYPVGASIGWNDPVLALPAPGDLKNRLTAPPGAEAVVTFVGPQGRESDPTSWNATAPWDLTPPGQWMADVTPYHLIAPGNGTPSGTNATATASGDYSLGVAYLTAGGQRVAPGGLFFVHIHLTGNAVPDKATYTWTPVQATGLAAGAGASRAPTGQQQWPGLLSFVAPASAATTDDPAGAMVVVVDAGGAAASGTGWTVVLSATGVTRTVATGPGARTVDASTTTGPTTTDPTTTGPTTLTLTLVSG
ncbi:MAG: hypothetical protein BGO38_00500 [Cellulomonas sp. 73-145]|uniref:hypothetical protein n=1 Tax=Cellulomonas sp. 73-145 TaxID=1895739 RepID=UPI0009260BBF|nr:hypothetical protein [Cellulomonas sp. 73-145]MBN9325864.1 hypothetical protein [Cellulomonas sp.]OJV60069.1 MAG: hypothetical protein BGO38_00500 [Cellulomonas sp. 73-145]